MSRFKKLSHTIWHCQYHLVWVPKYRHRILMDEVATEVTSCIKAFFASIVPISEYPTAKGPADYALFVKGKLENQFW